jgi:transposase
MAALNVADGTIRPKIIDRNNSDTFITFLTGIDQDTAAHQRIHLVMDNGPSHTSKATRAWLNATNLKILGFQEPEDDLCSGW